MKCNCVIEHKLKEMKDTEKVKLKNGRWALKGKDTKGHDIYRFIKKK